MHHLFITLIIVISLLTLPAHAEAGVTENQARSICAAVSEVSGQIMEDYYDGVHQEDVMARLDAMTYQPGLEHIHQIFKNLAVDVYTISGPQMKKHFTRAKAAASMVTVGNELCLKSGGYKPL